MPELIHGSATLTYSDNALGAISMGVPMLAWGLLAIAAPILIHMILRERPRREVFPAMRFLLGAHAAATRTQRLRQLLLLMARVGLLALAVGVLGRFGCTPQGGVAGLGFVSAAATPASVVICIDDSASMGYRYQGRTRVQMASDWAASLLQDPAQFGPGSQYALICGSPDVGTGGWRDNVRATVRQLEGVRPAYHSRGVADLLARACALMATARYARREVFVFTDLTESALSESPPPPPATPMGVYLMDVGQDENRNAVLAWPRVPNHAVPSGVPMELPVRVMAGDLPAEPVLELSIDGTPRGRQSVGMLAAGNQVDALLKLPGLTPGAHAIDIHMEPADALGCDNRRFGWIVAGDLPRIALVQSAGVQDVGRMIRAMIAPPAAPASEQRYAVEEPAVESLLDALKSPPLAVILADLKGLNSLAWDALAGFVKAGGLLLVIPGDTLSIDDYNNAGNLLPATLASVQTCDPPIRPAAIELSHAYLQAFADAGIDSINDRYAFKRLTFRPPVDAAKVVLAFSDGAPALLESRVGKGRVIVAAFSVAAEWGQFGTQAAPTIVLLHRILDTVRPALNNVGSFAAGRPVSRTLQTGGAPLTVTGDADREPSLVAPVNGQFRLPVDLPGVYRVASKSSPAETLFQYSSNAAEIESRPRRTEDIDSSKLRFGNDLMSILHPGEGPSVHQASGRGRISWAVPLGLALLALLLVESAFANRFYGSRRV